ncbi:MAG TPA: LuxR family transcriptional regulator [Steroidobacteraceae bacterium]|nr:LuxR family transcriptional regulator [Steroidobacteraceae bacterium]
MKQVDVVQGFIEGCQASPPSARRVAEGLPKALDALGFGYFAFCSHVDPLNPPPDAVMLHNYPAAWERHFSEARLHEIDPVLRRAERDPMPFFWDAEFQTGHLTKPQKQVLADAAGLGLAHGYTAPIHLSWLPGSLRASCSVVPDNSRVDPRNYPMVDALATYLFTALYRARAPWSLALPVDLTRRERECLALVALGMTDWEIGHLLNLSEFTVHSHIEHAKQRFGVSTRMQAVMLALMCGAITYGDVKCKLGGGNGGPGS